MSDQPDVMGAYLAAGWIIDSDGRWAEREATDVVADAPDSAPDDPIGAER